MLAALGTLAAIGWEPEIRGVLVITISVVILCGSIYLLLATNSGARLGFLQAVAGLSGWMVIMGIIWTFYGIGMVGSSPTWEISEVVVGDLDVAATTTARDLSDWTSLPEGDGARGEAEAVASEFLTENNRENLGIFLGDQDATPATVAVYDRGGKERIEKDPCSFHRPDTWGGCWDRLSNKASNTVRLTHPTRNSLVQVSEALHDADGDVVLSETGLPVPDPGAPVVNIVMTRDLGDKRRPPVLTTIASLIIFGVSASALHRRDKVLAAAKG